MDGAGRVIARSQAIEKYDTFLSVRGRSNSQKTIKATTPQTILQVAWLVMVVKQMVQVRM
jgi:hypothetical protein